MRNSWIPCVHGFVLLFVLYSPRRTIESRGRHHSDNLTGYVTCSARTMVRRVKSIGLTLSERCQRK